MTSSPFIGFSSLADGTLRGRFLTTARAFPLTHRQRLLQLAQDVSAYLRCRCFSLSLSAPAHRRSPFSMAAMIARGVSTVTHIRNENSL